MKPEHVELICEYFGCTYENSVFIMPSAARRYSESRFSDLIAAIEAQKDAEIAVLKNANLYVCAKMDALEQSNNMLSQFADDIDQENKRLMVELKEVNSILERLQK